MSRIIKVDLKETVNPSIVTSIIQDMSYDYTKMFDKVVVYKHSLTVNFKVDLDADDAIRAKVRDILIKAGKDV